MKDKLLTTILRKRKRKRSKAEELEAVFNSILSQVSASDAKEIVKNAIEEIVKKGVQNG